MIKIRNKRAMLELLKERVAFTKIAIVNNLDKDELTEEILAEASKTEVPVETLPIWKMSPSRSQEAKEVILGYLAPQKTWTLENLITELEQKGQQPFFLLVGKVNLANNIGAITRTAFAAGVNGLIFEGAKDAFFNEDTVHYSLGTIARIAHVKMNMFEALKELSSHGITTYALYMQSSPYFEADLKGPTAFVFGSEREGLSRAVTARCDKILAIPMHAGLDFLGVAASAAIVLYEKVRQDSLSTG